MNTCQNCGAFIDEFRYYCDECKNALSDENSVSVSGFQKAEQSSEQSINHIELKQALEEPQPIYERELANTLGRLQTRLYLARRGMQRGGLIFLGGVLLVIAIYLVISRTDYLNLIGLAPVVVGMIDFISSAFRYHKYKKALAGFTDEHAAILDELKAILADQDKD